MRKMIFMAIAGYLWKKYQANKAGKLATGTSAAAGKTPRY